MIVALYTRSDFHARESIYIRRISCITQRSLPLQGPFHDTLYVKQLPGSPVLLYVNQTTWSFKECWH